MKVTAAIPTYNRGRILTETLEHILKLQPPADEVLVLDQTARHEPAIREALESLSRSGKIRWIQLPEPSIPKSMNRALLEARCPIVLFLDDDLIPTEQLIADHARRYEDESIWAVCGQVLKPDQQPVDPPPAAGIADLEFPFHSKQGTFVRNVMAGNLSVRRERAIQVGGFDENFLGAAYRFETDFARRIWSRGGKIWFEPSARVVHLQATEGGVRSYGEHLKTSSPAHSVGDYYFAMTHFSGATRLRYVLRRLLASAATRFHLRHPWWILPKIIGELRGLILALRLKRRGPRLLDLHA